jgi:ABC-type phosphate transport system permease subunit
VYTSVFDGIIPQLVQGLEKNAEVSSAIAIVKEGLSPVIVVGLSGLASYLNAPREILIGACALSVVVVLITLTSRKEAIEDVIRRSISIRE